MAEAWVLGIEIGGTKLQLGIGPGTGDLAVLERLRVDPDRAAAGILGQLEETYPRLLDRVGLSRGQVRAAGIGFGGPVDDARGRIHRSYQVSGWDDYPLGDWIREHLEIPVVVVQNDAATAGFAEARFGAG